VNSGGAEQIVRVLVAEAVRRSWQRQCDARVLAKATTIDEGANGKGGGSSGSDT